MAFWQWFKAEGDKAFNFVSVGSLAVIGLNTSGQVHIPSAVTSALLVCSVLATTAHQIFFPNTQPGEFLK